MASRAPDSPSVRSLVNDMLIWRDEAQYLRDLRAVVRREQSLLDALAAKLVKAHRDRA